MKKITLGLIIGCCLPILTGYIFLISGGLPVATKGNPLPLERTIAQIALHKAIGDAEYKTAPITEVEINLNSGAKVYATNCMVCHGNLNSNVSTIAKGLFPKPPQLFQPGQGVTDDPIGEVYWKVKYGIRLTGMPGFVDGLTETEIWQVSALLLNSEKLPAKVRDTLMNSK